MTETYNQTEIPTITPRVKGTGRFGQLLDAHKAGKALSVPLDGKTLAVVRSSFAGTLALMARLNGYRIRSRQSDDRQSLVVWLDKL